LVSTLNYVSKDIALVAVKQQQQQHHSSPNLDLNCYTKRCASDILNAVRELAKKFVYPFFDVLLIVHLSTILVINQLNAQILVL